MSTLKDRRVQILSKLVNEVIAADPFERGGHLWAALSMEEWEERTGWSDTTVDRYFQKPPFYSEKATKEVGKLNPVRVKLVRVLASGEVPIKTHERIANEELRPLWLNRKIDHDAIAAKAAAGKPMKTATVIEGGKLKMGRREHGCLVGLAEAWPDGHQRAILEHVLADWPTFMVGVKLEKAVLQDEQTGDPDAPLENNLFVQFPHLPTIRRFHKVAVEIYQMHKSFKIKSFA